MTDEQWRAAWRLCEEVSGLSHDEQVAVLESATSDPDIARQVRAFLTNTTPALPQPRTLDPGTEVGRYVLMGVVGRGGMGQVYAAEDTELDRKVALKFVSAETGASDSTTERFIREARAASALNHPNIVTVHEVVRSEWGLAIAMELVEGVSLREHCREPLGLAHALELGRQLAQALAAAHAQGIVHRDIKPENIMLRRDGYVKILDFGLARRFGLSAGGFDPTVRHGVPAGTWRYMSPEQIRGETLGAPSDVFSLGLVLYEICTGVHPFAEDSPFDTAAAIATEKAERPSVHNPKISPELDQLILSMLERNPDERPSAAAVAEALQATQTAMQPQVRWIRDTRFRAILAVVLLVILAGAWLFRFGRRPATNESGDVSAPFRFQPLTDTPGEEASPSISRDGATMVYCRRVGPRWHVFVRKMGGNGADLSGDSQAEDTQPVLSPDGRSIAFRSTRDGGGLFVMKTDGTGLDKVAAFGYNPDWSPDSKTLLCATQPTLRPQQRLGPKSSLWSIDVQSHRSRRIYEGDAMQPAWSPSGKRIAFWAVANNDAQRPRNIWTISSDGTSAKPITPEKAFDWCPRWSADGRYIYFLSNREGFMNLWRVRVDESRGQALGLPEAQTTPSIDMSIFSFAASIPRMVYENRIISAHLLKMDLRTGETNALVTMPSSNQPVGPDVSSDGKWLVFYTLGRQEDLYVVAVDGTRLRQLTNDRFRDRGPRWSPDGQTIVFSSNRSGRIEIWTIRYDGSNLKQMTRTEGAEPIQPVWSPDGKRIVYSRTDGETDFISVNERGDPGQPQPLPAKGLQVRSWSPDGKKLLFERIEEPNSVTTMIEYDLQSGATRRLGTGRTQIWTPDGQHILFSRGGEIWRTNVTTLKEDRLADFGSKDLVGNRLSPDGKYLYVSVSSVESDIWLRDVSK